MSNEQKLRKQALEIYFDFVKSVNEGFARNNKGPWIPADSNFAMVDDIYVYISSGKVYDKESKSFVFPKR